jgi:hypothetical protein
VSRRLPIWQLYERARSLGLALQVSAQSWPGLAPGDDDRYRIAATADGGIWLLRTPHPEPATGLAGRRPAADTARRVLRAALWGHQGSSRVRDTPVADPAIIRSLGTGQAAYIYRGGVTYVQVKRLIAAPAALTREPATPGQPTAGPGPAAHAGAPPPPGHGTTCHRASRCRHPARRSVWPRNRLNRPSPRPTTAASSRTRRP